MIKIPTIFERDESFRVTPVVKPECSWVLEGAGFATYKMDGQNVKVEGGRLFKRQKPANGEPYTNASYVPCDPSDPSDKHLFQAARAAGDLTQYSDGIYEAVGPKIQGNPHNRDEPGLLKISPITNLMLLPNQFFDRSFEGLKERLRDFPYEGIVFHHPDGVRMAKIKRRDFGFQWPIRSQK